MQILIDGPKTIVFQPQHLATVLDQLANAPFRIAQPIIEDILKQVQNQNEIKEEKKSGDGQGAD